MKITWLGHASFLIESDGIRIITDPYDPEVLKLIPVTEKADIVIRSSGSDIAHAYVDSIPKPFDLITATEIVEGGVTVKGIEFLAVAAEESLYKKGGYMENALYRFTLEGINITHMGDVGNPLSSEQYDFLNGTDLLFALVGGHPTIELNDLEEVISRIKPKIVIPMHFRIPGPEFFMLPVTDFTGRYPDSVVHFASTSWIVVTREQLRASGEDLRIVVLKSEHGKR